MGLARTLWSTGRRVFRLLRSHCGIPGNLWATLEFPKIYFTDCDREVMKVFTVASVTVSQSNKIQPVLVPEFQDLHFENFFLIFTALWVLGAITVLLGKSRITKMKWVPQGHTADKYQIQEAGFKPGSLAAELGTVPLSWHLKPSARGRCTVRFMETQLLLLLLLDLFS